MPNYRNPSNDSEKIVSPKAMDRMIAWPQSTVLMDSLRQFVRCQLAELGHLEEQAFPMTERVVVRNGQPCGIYYCMHGPRSVKLTAVADMHSNKILFYGSDGQRAAQVPVPVHSSQN